MDSDSDNDVYAQDVYQILSDARFSELASEIDEDLFGPTREQILEIHLSESEDNDDGVLNWS